MASAAPIASSAGRNASSGELTAGDVNGAVQAPGTSTSSATARAGGRWRSGRSIQTRSRTAFAPRPAKTTTTAPNRFITHLPCRLAYRRVSQPRASLNVGEVSRPGRWYSSQAGPSIRRVPDRGRSRLYGCHLPQCGLTRFERARISHLAAAPRRPLSSGPLYMSEGQFVRVVYARAAHATTKERENRSGKASRRRDSNPRPPLYESGALAN
jgi:hypothetical protein